jgi:cytidyltransferase-like protein
MQKYKTGFVCGGFNILHMGHLAILAGAKERCERLIVGVFPVVKSKFCEIPLAERAEILKAVSYTDEVVVLDGSEDIKYDCFFTAEGKDVTAAPEADIIFLHVVQGQNEEELKRRAEGIKILAFGAGKIFDRYMKGRGAKYPPAYVFDNDAEKWGKTKHGILIKPPSELPQLVKNGGKILITCANLLEVDNQLKEMGITEYYSPR